VHPAHTTEHREYHQIGKHTFALKYGLDYPAISARLNRAYREECGREGAA
jgi:hypothetical protein